MTENEWRSTYLEPMKTPDGIMTVDEADALVMSGLAALSEVRGIEHHKGSNWYCCRLGLALLYEWETKV